MMSVSVRGFRYRPDIQGLRALAVLLVVAYHADLGFPGGYVGVDVFFVLSGFVIIQMLLSELQANGRIAFRTFYLRRIRRLLPALAVLLSVTMVLAILLGPLGSQRYTARTGAAAAVFNANTYLASSSGDGGYFGLSAEANAMLHTWSLSVEEQFYLVVPALIAGTWAVAARYRRNALRLVGGVLAVMCAGSFVGSWLVTTGRITVPVLGQSAAFYSAPTRAWEFAVGGLVAVAAVRGVVTPARLASALAWLGLAAIGVATFAFDSGTPFPGTAALVPVLGALALVLAGMTTERRGIVRWLGARPCETLGDLSYSWYLWHWPMLVFAVALFPGSPYAKTMGALVSLLPAWLSYRFVEIPIRYRRPVMTGRTLALGTACVLVPLVAALGLTLGHRYISKVEQVGAFALHADVRRGCDSPVPFGQRGEQCRWPVDQRSGYALLIGDSNAGQYTEGFVAAANALGMDAEVATKSGCPFANVELREKEIIGSCTRFVTASTSAIVERRPRLVVMASSSDRYISSPRFSLRGAGSSGFATDSEAKAAVWSEGVRTMVMRLIDAGIPVVVVHVPPRMEGAWAPIKSAPLRLIHRASWLSTSVPRQDALAARAASVEAEKSAAEVGAIMLDVFDELCPTDVCSAFGDEQWSYRDADHISVAASRRLEPWFRAAMSEALAGWR